MNLRTTLRRVQLVAWDVGTAIANLVVPGKDFRSEPFDIFSDGRYASILPPGLYGRCRFVPDYSNGKLREIVELRIGDVVWYDTRRKYATREWLSDMIEMVWTARFDYVESLHLNHPGRTVEVPTRGEWELYAVKATARACESFRAHEMEVQGLSLRYEAATMLWEMRSHPNDIAPFMTFEHIRYVDEAVLAYRNTLEQQTALGNDLWVPGPALGSASAERVATLRDRVTAPPSPAKIVPAFEPASAVRRIRLD